MSNARPVWPGTFVEQMQQLLDGEAPAFFQSLEQDSPVTVRLHPMKTADLSHLPVTEEVPWCADGRYLRERPLFAADPLWHAGGYYVQEASSMALWQALEATGLRNMPLLALDLCGAPGGKATHLNSWLHPDSTLVVNEVIRSRASILADQMIRWGYPNTLVWNQDPDRLRKLGPIFQLITVDAPCSGEGMFRKDQLAVQEWSPAHVLHCAARQERILEAAWQLLEPGGYLIYSTCTFNEAENERQVARMVSMGGQVVPIPNSASWGWTEATTGGYHLYPHRLRGEGLFVVLIRKSDGSPRVWAPPLLKTGKLPASFPQPWLAAGDWYLQEYHHTWTALPRAQASTMDYLARQFSPLHVGLPLGVEKGKDWIPHHGWALSTTESKWPVCALTLDEARTYLARQPLSLPQLTPGWHVATYKGWGLGWLKAIPGRINNYLPTHWRIRDWDKIY